MPLQQILPTWLALNACNDPSPTGMQNLETNNPYYAGGLNLGDYFDITDQEAKNLSNLATGLLYAGRYRRIQVDSGATAANIKTGTIGLMIAGGQPQLNVVTSYDKGIVGAHNVVFLNSIAPGNYGFVQELGIESILCGASIQKAAPATGDLVDSATGGVLNDLTAQAYAVTSMGIALSAPSPNTLCLVLYNGPVLQG